MSGNNQRQQPRRIEASQKTPVSGYNLKPGIRNLILIALIWSMVTNMMYIIGADDWLILSWLFGSEIGRAVWGTISILLPGMSCLFIRILQDADE